MPARGSSPQRPSDPGRRRFLVRTLALGGLLCTPLSAPRAAAGRIGLALGGGGAKGLAHIPVLELLDELGIRPARVAGTSIGAVLGGLYCAGLSGRSIRALLDDLIVNRGEDWSKALFDQQILRWWDFFDTAPGRGGLVDPGSFIDFLRMRMGTDRFEALAIPLSVVATDFWERRQVVLQDGDLPSAIRASMAVPGLFPPVEREGQVLVDGGLVNPVPYDLLLDDCDLVIAVDVLGERTAGDAARPDSLENVFNALLIQQAALTREKLRRVAPEVYLRPGITDVRMLEFYRAEEIYAQTEPARERLRKTLTEKLDRGA
jgi:NTE family protein